ncbi:hypothetical protein [Paenibacillus sp. 32O-W]|uniref:hypothetical protein n=1 Tax=Paenibacillus sp. 32O-W TaxID=1695218 RepID=UPI0011A3C977|nr:MULTISPECIES: hypothetical protein [Paenibacillaceae]
MKDTVAFEFDQPGSAAQACDMLNELGYKSKAVVHITIEQGDLTSALEIAQAYGGRLRETQNGQEETVLASAYDMDAVPIPAHTVNEDWPEQYLHSDGELLSDDTPGDEEQEPFDPSGEDYNHFSAGVHL